MRQVGPGGGTEVVPGLGEEAGNVRALRSPRVKFEPCSAVSGLRCQNLSRSRSPRFLILHTGGRKSPKSLW